MKPSIHILARIACVAYALVFWAAIASAEPHQLFAESGSGRTWVGKNEKKTGEDEHSRIIEKKEAAGDHKESWMETTVLAAAIQGVARQGSDLIVWHSNRAGEHFAQTWAMIWKDRYSSGASLPKNMPIAAIAGDATALYAIGLQRESDQPIPVEMKEGTTPRQESTALPGNAPLTAAYRPALYKLSKNWIELPGSWPVDCPIQQNGDVSLAIINGIPHALVRDASNQFAILTHDGAQWTRQSTVPMPPKCADAPPGRRFKLLQMENDHSPIIWFGYGVESAGNIWIKSNWVSVASPAGNTSPELMDLTIANNAFLLYYQDGGNLIELPIGMNGIPGNTKIIKVAPKSTGDYNWVSLTVLAIFTALIFNTLFRSRQKEPNEDNNENSN